jgi:hypothetical protein
VPMTMVFGLYFFAQCAKPHDLQPIFLSPIS